MKNQSFILTTLFIAEQFRKSGIRSHALIKLTISAALSDTDFNEFGILLTANACLCKMQWLLIRILDKSLYKP
jgi:hypothetical protein